MKNKNTIIIAFVLLILILIFLITSKETKGELIKINYKEIKEKIEKKEDFILVVSRTTCSHCLEYKPKIKEIAKKYSINIYYIDYDEESKKNQDNLLKDLNLDGSTPTTMFFEKGKETSLMDRLTGDLSKTKVIEKFKKVGFIKK